MSISIVAFEDKIKWNSIAKSFVECDVYYLHEYVDAFRLHGDGVPELIYFETEGTRAMNVVMKRDVSEVEKLSGNVKKNTLYDYSTPYGYGGFLVEGEVNSEVIGKLEKEYTQLCIDNNIVCEFLRCHPLLKNSEYLGDVYALTQLGNTITMPLHNKEFIWNNVISKNRNMIRKAEKNGVEIRWGNDSSLYDVFIEMYNKTMDKDNAKDYYYFKKDFYDSIINELKDNSMMFYAIVEEKIIAMSIIMFCNGKLHYHLSASEKEYLKYAPTNLLLYKVACWGADNGYGEFHLGSGLGFREDSLYSFKKSFIKDTLPTPFHMGKKVFMEDKYEELCDLCSVNKESVFFPLYRE